MLPNEKVDKNGKRAEVVLTHHITTVRKIEDSTGLSFFDKVNARDRRHLEGLKSITWIARHKCS